MSADYLRGAFGTDKNHVVKAYRLVDEIQRVFPRFFNHDERAWPYLVSEEEDEQPNRQYSFSTNAMIMFSLATSAGLLGSSALFPTQVPRRSIDKSQKPDDPEYTDVLHTGLLRLIEESDALDTEANVVRSQTFGDDDPFTLTWVAAVCRAAHPSLSAEIANFESRLSEKTEDRLRDLKDQISQKDSERGRAILEVPIVLEKSKDPLNDAVPHVFSLLRMAHLALERGQLRRVLSHSSSLNSTELASYNLMQVDADLARPMRQIFRDRVHLQLSYHRIPDSDFDIGELVFALEGLLLAEEGVESNLITTVFEAIEEKQAHNPYWRPLRPFIVNPQGFALLPLSVEVANSLLRSCLILEQKEDQDISYFSQYVDLFRRYEQWLRSRMVRGRAAGEKDFVGWHSEHVLPPDAIHLWDTSQVLLFFVLYAELMQRHLALRALDAADLRALDQGSDGVQEEQLANTDSTRAQERNGEAPSYNEVDRPDQPTLSPSVYDIRARMEADFVDQWSISDGPNRRNCSMLFYGPPGTGKTTLARGLATRLGWPMISVTPSDFIRLGAEAVETRAKDIFDALREQHEVVILFDEIDRLILDRDSKFYEQQGDVFQFMTPSMLTKLQDLHDVQRSIFIISTNYAERIDSAIKRPGRIDKRYLVLPPDRGTRREKLYQVANEVLEEGLDTSAVQEELDNLLNKTVLATHGEIRALTQNFGKKGSVSDAALKSILNESAADFRPSIRISTYQSRFKATNEALQAAEEPYDEVLMLLGMYRDEDEHLPEPEKEALLKMLDTSEVNLDRDLEGHIGDLVKDCVAEEVRDSVLKELRKLALTSNG